MDFIISTFNNFIILMKTFTIFDFIDIIIMSFIIFNVIKLVRETRASQLVKGILILILAYIISSQFNLKMLSFLLNKFFEFGIIALLIVFQPELRRALEQIGRSKISSYWTSASKLHSEISFYNRQKACINCIVNAVGSFQNSKTGALIVFERETKLGDIANTGTIINAKPSVPIISNIFYNKAPLHDGAMIIRDGKVYAAACILPLTKNESISIDIGTRHRAAIGITEISDAIAIVVSEENGTISVATNGVLSRNYSTEKLKNKLERTILPEFYDANIRHQIFETLTRKRKNEKK